MWMCRVFKVRKILTTPFDMKGKDLPLAAPNPKILSSGGDTSLLHYMYVALVFYMRSNHI